MKGIDVYWMKCETGVDCREAILRQRYGESRGVCRDEGGKPRFCDGGEGFSISHSGPYYLMAFCPEGEIGLDGERTVDERIRWKAVARRYFTSEEQEELERSPQPRREFTRLWTKYEARVKFTGEGLGGLRSQKGREAVYTDISPLLQAATGDGDLFGAVVCETSYEIRLLPGGEP